MIILFGVELGARLSRAQAAALATLKSHGKPSRVDVALIAGPAGAKRNHVTVW